MMWIGPKGTFTPLHHDLTNNLLLQLVGRKVVLMAAPGETPKLYNDHHVYSRIRDLTAPDVLKHYPKLDGVRVHRVLLSPGDALFIPLGWWHQVRALDFSITITHTNFLWPNDAYETYPRT
jgi:ribosomal protein L16 Arg81 hydroxylase